MDMHFTQDPQKFVARQIESGAYPTPSDVVREALHLLAQHDPVLARHKDEIRTGIDEGWEAAQRHELVDGDGVFDRIDAELEAMERSAPR